MRVGCVRGEGRVCEKANGQSGSAIVSKSFHLQAS